MKVRVKLFALLRDRIGQDELALQLPDAATVADLRRRLAEQYPGLVPLLEQVLIAVDSEYARDDEPLSPDAEIACVPPVSGGGRDAQPMITLTHNPIDYAELTERVRSTQAGAVVLFLGTVREFTEERQTASVDYEAYPQMAEQKLAEIEREARQRWPIVESAIVHRLGHLELGEVSIAVAVSCPHRAEAFEAARWLMDRIKEVVPIWKKENWADGTSEWVHPGLETVFVPHN